MRCALLLSLYHNYTASAAVAQALDGKFLCLKPRTNCPATEDPPSWRLGAQTRIKLVRGQTDFCDLFVNKAYHFDDFYKA